MTAPSLSASSHVERVAALEATHSHLDGEHAQAVRKLDEERLRLSREHAAAKAAASEAARAKHDELDAKIGAEARAVLFPLLADFAKGDSSRRPIAGKIRDAWIALDTKARDCLGNNLDRRLLALGIAAAHGLESVAASCEFLRYGGASQAMASVDTVVSRIEAAIALPAVEDALHAAEVAIATSVSGRGFHAAPWRAAAFRFAMRASNDRAADEADRNVPQVSKAVVTFGHLQGGRGPRVTT